MRYNVLSSQSGLSIIATVMVMMILALFAAVAVSLVTTGSSIGLQEEQGVEAFYIAEGGMHYAAKKISLITMSVLLLILDLALSPHQCLSLRRPSVPVIHKSLYLPQQTVFFKQRHLRIPITG